MKDLKLNAGDLVEIYNNNGSTQAMAYPKPTAKRKQAFMLFDTILSCNVPSVREWAPD